MRTHVPWIGVLGALIAAPQIAGAADCPPFAADPIVIVGSSAIAPLVDAMQQVLVQQAAPTTLIYGSPGSCVGVTAVAADTKADCTQGSPGACITGSVVYYTPSTTTPTSPTKVTCTIPVTSPMHVDVGLSDVWAETCLQVASGAAGGVKDTTGPVEPMVFVVPRKSFVDGGNKAITAEEAYFVFGFGAAGQAQPWIVDRDLQVRNAQSGTQQVIANNISVPAGRWKGTSTNAAGIVAALNAANTAANPGTFLGILGSDVYDLNRDKLSALAYQAFHQKGAFYPDSTATSLDKRNVRDGHYVNWGYLHMVTRLDADSKPNAAGKRFVDWVTGNTSGTGTPAPTAPTWDMTALTIRANLIPTCAMKVSRTAEGGALAPFAPPVDCTATFEATVAH